MIFGWCLVGVIRVSGGCLEGIWRVSGKFWKVSGRFWMVSGRCLDVVKKVLRSKESQ